MVIRREVGRLVIKNKALGGARQTQRLPKVARTKTIINRMSSQENRQLQDISEVRVQR